MFNFEIDYVDFDDNAEEYKAYTDTKSDALLLAASLKKQGFVKILVINLIGGEIVAEM